MQPGDRGLGKPPGGAASEGSVEGSVEPGSQTGRELSRKEGHLQGTVSFRRGRAEEWGRNIKPWQLGPKVGGAGGIQSQEAFYIMLLSWYCIPKRIGHN